MNQILCVFLLATTLDTPGDSITTVSLTEILESAKAYHPIIRQAGLQPGFAKAELTASRGSLDPKLSSTYALKDLNDTRYYSKFNSSFKIPLWFPLDSKISVSRNSGQYLNPENYVSSSSDFWQVSTGVSVPVGKGLYIDERRTLIKQAKVYGSLAEAEQIKLVNATLLDIISSYWDWYMSFQSYQLMEKSLEISQNLLDQVKLDLEYGEAAPIDTVQAMITYQNQLVEYQQAYLELRKAQFGMEVHMWARNEIPLELNEQVIPTGDSPFMFVPDSTAMNLLSLWIVENHPDIKKLTAKKTQLEIEQKWNRESLKPEVNLSYSSIDAPVYYEGTQPINWNDNYTVGVDFSFPILLRKERGKLQKTKLGIESMEYELSQASREIVANVKAAFTELGVSAKLAIEYEKMAENYRRLLDAELMNVQGGESDLFKLNIQQEKYIAAQVKAFQARAKVEKLKAYLPYAAGLPYLSYDQLYE